MKRRLHDCLRYGQEIQAVLHFCRLLVNKSLCVHTNYQSNQENINILSYIY